MAMRVADAVWVAAAMLHRTYPDRPDFSVAEIVEKATAENMGGVRMHGPSVQAYASVHCVAGKKPQPNRAKMLTETARGRRRLYRPEDPCHPDRRSGASLPDRNALPPAYRILLDWHRREYLGSGMSAGPEPGHARLDTDGPHPSMNEAAVAWLAANPVPAADTDPLLALYGSGRGVWADEDADSYVRRLRDGWD